jgi:hypothetical protein
MAELEGFDTARAFEFENGFYWTSPLSRLGKLLGQYEVYKRIVGVPGEVVECGVYKGASLVRLASFRELLEAPDSRKVIAFDAFGRFPRTDDTEESVWVEGFERAGGDGLSVTQLEQVFRRKGFRNTEFVPGDINETVPAYARAHGELRIALLHIDVDLYEPTATVLAHFFERVVPGGVVVFDDYGRVAGATRAIDEFLRDHPHALEKPSICHIPAFVTKRAP